MDIFIIEDLRAFNHFNMILLGPTSRAEQCIVGLIFVLIALCTGFLAAVASSHKLTWRRCLILWPYEVDNDDGLEQYFLHQVFRTFCLLVGTVIIFQSDAAPLNAKVIQLELTQSVTLGPRCERWTLTPEIVNVQLSCYHDDQVTKQTVPLSYLGPIVNPSLIQDWTRLGIEPCNGALCLKILTDNVDDFVDTVPTNKLYHHLNSVLYSLNALRNIDDNSSHSMKPSNDSYTSGGNAQEWTPVHCWRSNTHCVDDTVP